MAGGQAGVWFMNWTKTKKKLKQQIRECKIFDKLHTLKPTKVLGLRFSPQTFFHCISAVV